MNRLNKNSFQRLPGLLAILLMVQINLTAQLAGVLLNEPEAENGYVLLKIPDLDEYFLIDNCGGVVNSWKVEDPYYNHAKLLPNGNLLYFRHDRIVELTWEGSVDHVILFEQLNIELDYEVIKMESGNYLAVGRKNKSDQEFLDLGFDLSDQFPQVVDVIIEIDYETGDLVWEWDISDHIIQERNPNAGNFGVVAEHPELLDVDAISDFDWTFYESFMINGFDYNPTLDQCALSIRKMSEVIIIDQSTTTAEAATGSGGNSGKGGDVLFRWGNPQNYGRGNENDRKLWFQHNPKWATVGPYAGKLTAFNNGLDRQFNSFSFSEAPVIDTEVDATGQYQLDENDEYSSGEPLFIYHSVSESDNFYSGYLSGAQLLPNGNAFITVGGSAQLKEFDRDGKLLWEFQYPGNDSPFRTEKYLDDYPAFEGKDLSPDGLIMFTKPLAGCTTTSIEEPYKQLSNIGIKRIDKSSYEITNPDQLNLNLQLHDMKGQKLSTLTVEYALIIYEIPSLVSGMYLLSIQDKDSGQQKSIKLVITE